MARILCVSMVHPTGSRFRASSFHLETPRNARHPHPSDPPTFRFLPSPQAPPAARPRASRSARRAVTRAAVSAPCELVECGADFETSERAATVNGKTVRAASLRAVDVLTPSGKTVTLGDEVGQKGVVVLLRHLG